MSFDLPANLEREIENYAQAEHISPEEAAVRLLEEILTTKKLGSKGTTGEKVEIGVGAGSVSDLIRRARAERAAPQPITATAFFQEIQTTKGFKSKAAAHKHIQDLRNEWL